MTLSFRDLGLVRGLVAALPSPLDHCPSHASQLARTKSREWEDDDEREDGEGVEGSDGSRFRTNKVPLVLVDKRPDVAEQICLPVTRQSGRLYPLWHADWKVSLLQHELSGWPFPLLLHQHYWSAAREKCCISVMPFTFLNPADRKVLQSKVGTSTFPASSLTSCDRLAVEDASTSSAMSDRQDTLVRRNLRLMRPKHQSGTDLVWPASMTWMLMVVCRPDKTRHSRYCIMNEFLFCLHSCPRAGASPSHPGRTVSGSGAGN